MAKLTSSEIKFKIEAAPLPDMNSFRELNIIPDQIISEIPSGTFTLEYL